MFNKTTLPALRIFTNYGMENNNRGPRDVDKWGFKNTRPEIKDYAKPGIVEQIIYEFSNG